ncbi:hypothetical protein EST38_g2703 [Candolleomyces aberdarensis]|uniref:BTB domain-containing protein n=1 Tax=Candolleomyces aberdarensis TaxID=2316362 RepID=A0A4Q2DTX6_9AGAR|nr:hypothetical protein EST38_g2703 [Candolleomyces aberdarensis]
METDCVTQVPTVVDPPNSKPMTALTNIVAEEERDEIYYWDTVKFLVKGSIFKVPRYQFVIGSTYFAEKLGSTELSDKEGDEAPVILEGTTASHFRVFLKLLFPIHTTSTTIRFTKDEWLIILELSTLWRFHEFRKLAKEHLDPQLNDPVERIVLGRAAYVPNWVSDGYESLVTRQECINEDESERIGHLTTVRLYILRHERCFDATRFCEEIHSLEKMERDHMSVEEKRIEEEKRLEEERLRHDREEKQRLKEEEEERVKEEERQMKEEEEERQMKEEEERQMREEERRRKEEEERLMKEEEEQRMKEEEERWRKEEEERLMKEEEEQRMKEEEERWRKEEEERLMKEEEQRRKEEKERRRKEKSKQRMRKKQERQMKKEEEERQMIGVEVPPVTEAEGPPVAAAEGPPVREAEGAPVEEFWDIEVEEQPMVQNASAWDSTK